MYLYILSRLVKYRMKRRKYWFDGHYQKYDNAHTAVIDDVSQTCGYEPFYYLKDKIHPGTLVLNLGCGHVDGNKAIEAYVLNADPYNVSDAQNQAVQRLIRDTRGVEFVISASVLNVIADTRVRLEHFYIASSSLHEFGVAYFFVYTGNDSQVSTLEKNTFQRNSHAKVFVEEAKCFFKLPFSE